jgi:putrescine importer
MSINVERVAVVETASTQPRALRRNALGLLGAMMLGVVLMSPAISIYFSWGFMIPSVGVATAAVFAIALIMSLPTAYSYALINSRIPSAGASYKWASRLISPHLGIAVGFILTLFYACIIPAEVAILAVLGADLVRSESTTVIALIMAGSLLAAAPFVFRGVTFNIETAAVLVTIEVAIITIVAIGAFIASDHSHASLAPLNPANLPSVALLIPALVLGVNAFTGYDAVSTISEETRTARRLIPRATILSVVLVGLIWIVLSTILSDAIPPAAYVKVINAGGLPLTAAAQEAFSSAGRDVVNIMGIEATFSVVIAATIGSTRVLYAMGRDGVLNPRFGQVHPRFRVPWMSIAAALVFTAVVLVVLSIYVGIGINIAIWLANLITFLALVTYIVINVCNPLLFWRHLRTEANWFANGVVPAVGVAVSGYFLYRGFFKVLWETDDFKLGGSIIVVAVALVVLSFIAAAFIARRPAARLAARGEPVEDVLATADLTEVADADLAEAGTTRGPGVA